MKPRFSVFITSVIGALFLMIDAFINGYPIFYFDSNTYMMSGITPFFPIDRPITYGLFIRLFSLNTFSLWTVIFMQSFILSYLIVLFTRLILGEKRLILQSLAIILFLSLFTGLSWVTSQILTDIFTSTALLSMFLLVFGQENKTTRILLYIIFCISVLMHLSHIVLFSCTLVFILALRKWLLPEFGIKKKLIHIFALLVLTLLAEFPMRPALDRSKYVFFMSAMVEQGIAKNYLDEYCGTKHYKLCKYKDSLPASASDFIWSTSSPFNKMGGWTDSNRDEFADITYATLTKPKYLWLHIKGSVKATAHQLAVFDICDGNPPFKDPKGLIYPVISKYFNREFNTYIHSKQNISNFAGLDPLKVFYRYIVWLCLIPIILLLVYRRGSFKGPFRSALIIFLTLLLLSDWDVATFSCVADRYGCKIMWLIPLIAIISVFKIVLKNTEKIPDQE